MAQAHFHTALTKRIFGVGVYGTEKKKKRMVKDRKRERAEESKKIK